MTPLTHEVPVHLYQIPYSAPTLAQVEPGYRVLDNLANERPDWFEYWPIRRFLLAHALDDDAFYGFFSPKFGRKTLLSHDDVSRFVRASAAQADVVLFSPQPDMGAFFLNVFEQAVKATANMQPLAVGLTVKSIEMIVDVNAGQNELGVDADSSLTTDTITGDALLDLPDNEEDLLAYLTELAAARGIVDGELNIRVDGFENTYLPNRNEIQEIRIVNTSFSADGGGTGPRIEIVTRPGTGAWTAPHARPAAHARPVTGTGAGAGRTCRRRRRLRQHGAGRQQQCREGGKKFRVAHGDLL